MISTFGKHLWSRLRWVFPVPSGGDELRHRFTATAITVAVLMALVTAPLFWLVNHPTALVVLAFAALTTAVGLAFRLTRRHAVGFWGLQATVTFLCVVGAWTELGPHTGWAMWLAILPLTGLLYGGARAGAVGLTVATLASFLVVLYPNPPFLEATASTPLSALVRVVCFFAAVVVLGASWQSMRDRALERAEAAGRARTLFLANMSHELRTPMNGVVGLADLLLASNPRPEHLETLGVMRRSGQQLLTLINDIIDFARLDAGRMPLSREPVDIRRVATDTVELLRPTVKPGGPFIELRLAADLPIILGDEVRLRQVLVNLVGNAVKFTHQGSVSLSISRHDERLRVMVKDTGVGIAPDVQARLFRPFEQADVGSNRRFAGSGLGLAISRELIELMGGTIDLESEPGRGSTFTVSLPLTATTPTKAVATEETATSLAPTGHPRSVLVVDDNDVNLFVAVALLKKAGCHPTTATSGTEAVARVSETDFDLVLMDCHMPGLDGFEATRRIRQLTAPRCKVPIVALTASALPEELTRCLEAGMNGCLTKPVTLDALTTTLGQLFGASPEQPVRRGAA